MDSIVNVDLSLIRRAADALERDASTIEPSVRSSLRKATPIVESAIKARMRKAIDRPRASTTGAVRSDVGATGNGGVEARVYITGAIATQLARLEQGGTVNGRRDLALQILMPSLLNAYGDLGRGGVRRLVDRAATGASTGSRRFFVARIGKAYGVWMDEGGGRQRGNRRQGPRLVVRFLDKATYKPRLGLRQAATEAAEQAAGGLEAALERAIRGR